MKDMKDNWKEFSESGLLWWVNRILHTFGWSIVYAESDSDGELIDVYPMKTNYTGFGRESEERGFKRIKDNFIKEP